MGSRRRAERSCDAGFAGRLQGRSSKEHHKRGVRSQPFLASIDKSLVALVIWHMVVLSIALPLKVLSCALSLLVIPNAVLAFSLLLFPLLLFTLA